MLRRFLWRRKRLLCPYCGNVVDGRRVKCQTCGGDLKPMLSALARSPYKGGGEVGGGGA
jgi:hypothetical protein